MSDFIDDYLQEQHDDFEYTRQLSPSAQVYHYLTDLPLHNAKRGVGPHLGQLDFYDGICPGNDAYAVIAHNLQTVCALQQRLLDLGQSTQIVVKERGDR